MEVMGKECYLLDDGTLDTVVAIDGEEHRIGQEKAREYRALDGSFTTTGFRNLCEDIIEACEE